MDLAPLPTLKEDFDVNAHSEKGGNFRFKPPGVSLLHQKGGDEICEVSVQDLTNRPSEHIPR